jgi:hypothetical protein
LRVDSWRNESVVRLLPGCKNLSTKAENIVRIRYQATTEDIANTEYFMYAADNDL